MFRRYVTAHTEKKAEPNQIASFHMAVGHAVCSWQYVEHNLYRIYARLIQGKDQHAVSAAFHVNLAFHAKLKMVNSAAKFTINNTTTKDRWKKLNTRLSVLAEKRNQVVHFTEIFDSHEENPDKAMKLRPNFLDANKDSNYKNATYEEYTESALHKLASSFEELAGDLDEFIGALPPLSKKNLSKLPE
jgi:hypothetical protein